MPKSVDGDIRISVAFDDSGILKGKKNIQSSVSSVSRGMKKLGNEISAAYSKGAMQAERYNAKLAKAKEKIKEQEVAIQKLQSKLEALKNGDATPKSLKEMDSKIASAQKEFDELVTKMEAAKEKVDMYDIGAEWNPLLDKAKEEYAQLAEQVAEAGGELDAMKAKAESIRLNPQNSTEGKELAKQLEAANSQLEILKIEASFAAEGVDMVSESAEDANHQIKKMPKALATTKKNIKSISPALKSVSSSFKRFKRLLLSAFVFNVFSKSMRVLQEQLSALLKSNEQFSTSIAKIKGNLITAFTPIYQSVLPAINAMMQGLEKATASLATFFSELSGKTLAETKKDAEELYEQATAAQKSLASFDEINKISTKDSEGAATPDFSIADENSASTEKAISLAERIKQAFEPLQSIDISNLETSLTNIKNSLSSLGEEAFAGLLWGVENVLPEIASFTVETVLPSFLDSLSTAVDTAKETFKKAKTPFKTFYKECLKPLADYTKPQIAEYLDDLNEKLEELKTMVEETEAFDDLNEILSSLSGILTTVGELVIDFKFEQLKFKVGQAWITFKYKLKDIEDGLGLIAALLRGDFSDAFDHAKDLLVDNKIDQAKERFENLKTTIQNVTTSISNFASEMKTAVTEAFNNWKDGVSEWWENDVSPWFTKEKWSELLQSIGASLALAVAGMRDVWNEQIVPWWENDVKPWFTAEKWAAIWSDAKASIQNFFTGEDGFVQTWKTKISSWWESEVLPWFTFERWKAFGDDMREGVITGFKNITNGIANIINNTISSFEKLVNSVIWGLNQIISGYNTMAGMVNLPTVDLLKNVDLSKYKIPTVAQGAVVPNNVSYMSFTNSNAIDTDALAEKISSNLQIGFGSYIGSASSKDEAILEIDGEKFGRLIYKLNKKESKRVGVNFSEG